MQVRPAGIEQLLSQCQADRIYLLDVCFRHTQRTKCKRRSGGITHLEVRDGVRSWQPRGAWVLLGAEGPVESLRDCAEVVCTNCRGSNAVPGSQERKIKI